MEIGILIASILAAIAAVAALIVSLANGGASKQTQALSDQLRALQEQQRADREALAAANERTMRSFAELTTQSQQAMGEAQAKQMALIDEHMRQKQDALQTTVTVTLEQLENRFKTFEVTNEQKLDAVRNTMEQRLQYIQEDNNRKLDAMRQTVDEKLQKTLEDKMTQSFRLVNERLEQVYKGLGEMQTLASGVGDLKKVLSNVKTRGILGEIQLGAILEEILASEQYDTNVATIPGSKNPVEYAVKLPGNDGGHVYLPIDSKFPGDAYAALQDAYDSGSAEAVQAAASTLMTRIKQFAKDIRDKYIEPPYTTDFGIMFLPFEGLYAEAVNRGLVEVLQRDYRVNLAGPSTMAALLNSLQMGFKTLAIQKQSSKVWKILGAVKSEFDKFGDILSATQMRLDQANKELDKLVGVRTRAIQRQLRDVEKLEEGESVALLDLGVDEAEE